MYTCTLPRFSHWPDWYQTWMIPRHLTSLVRYLLTFPQLSLTQPVSNSSARSSLNLKRLCENVSIKVLAQAVLQPVERT